MIHPHTELKFIHEDIGYGVVATRFIPKGTIIWALDKLDRVFTPKEISKLGAAYDELIDKYTYRDARGNYILCWDHGRFMNHSFHPNCMITPYNCEIAIKHIYPDEQLTDDYGYLNVSFPFIALPEKGSSRKVVMPDDLLHYHREWDAELKEAFRYYGLVDQPLEDILPEKTRDTLQKIANGRKNLKSIISCYHDENKILKTRIKEKKKKVA